MIRTSLTIWLLLGSMALGQMTPIRPSLDEHNDLRDATVYRVDTVADIETMDPFYLTTGKLIRTSRRSSSHTRGDGSGALYYYNGTGASGVTDNSGFTIIVGPAADDYVTLVDQSVIHPRQWGAAFNGSTDDQTIMQACIDELEGGGVLELPEGATCLLGGYLLMQNGSGAVINGNGCTFKTADGTTISNNTQGILQLKLCDHVTIRDVTFDGNVQNRTHPHTQASTYNVQILGSNNVLFENCVSKNAAMDGWYVAANGTPSTPDDRSENIQLNNCTADACYRQGISVIACKGLSVNGGILVNTKGIMPMAGIDLEPNPLSLSAWAATTAYVAGDVREDAAGYSFLVRKTDGTSASTFTAAEADEWFLIPQVEGVTLNGVVLEDNAGSGIQSTTGAEAPTITGCVIRNNQRAAMRVQSGVKMYGGTISDWTQPPAWETAHAYVAGDWVYDSGSGEWGCAKTDFTSGASYAADGSDAVTTLNANMWYVPENHGCVSQIGGASGAVILDGVDFFNITPTTATQTACFYSIGSTTDYHEITKCHAWNSEQFVSLASTRRAKVKGCNIHDVSGTAVNVGTGSLVDGNYFRNLGGRAVNCGGKRCTVVNNFVEDSAVSDGVFRFFDDYCVARNNTFHLTTPGSWAVLRIEGNNCEWTDNIYSGVTPTFFTNGGDFVLNDTFALTATGTITLVPGGKYQIDSSAGAVTATLGSGRYIGQVQTLVMTNATTSSTLSVTNHETSDPEVFTFDAVDEYLSLIWTGTEWATLNGTATAP